MRIVLLGAPGSGKGTQAAAIVDRYRIPHISTGELLRAEVAAGSPLGQQAKAIMDSGSLVSDDIILGMIRERLGKPDVENGFMFDGFPRTLVQAEGLDTLLAELNQPVDRVIFFDVDYSEIIQRMLARGRSDDTEDAIRKRLQVYEAQTAPLIDYYKTKGSLRTVQGMGDIEAISRRIFNVLGESA